MRHIPILLLVVAVGVATLDRSPARAATACRSNAECACGWNASRSACEVGSRAELDSSDPQCNQFCYSFDRTLTVVCRANECVRTRRSPCPGDCDADLVVTVNELVAGVSIALDESPVTACDAFDSSGNSSITVDEIVDGVVTALDGCASALRLPSDVAALYDTSMTFDGQYSATVLGMRSVSVEPTTLSFDIGPNQGLSLTGNVGADGRLHLQGFGVVTDYGYQAHATARRSEGPTQERIEGEVQTEGGIASPFMSATFVMQRDATTPVPFSGIYRLDLSVSPGDEHQASAVILRLDAGATGAALITGGTDTGADGTVLGSMSSGRCLLASGGSLSCNAVYLVQDSDVSAPFRLTGKLDVATDGVTGSGSYLVGVDPPYNIYVLGGWTATRVGSTAH